MPRRREVAKRKVLPDPKFGDRIVAKFMNTVMMSGKKSTAEKIVYSAFDLIGEKELASSHLTFSRRRLKALSRSSKSSHAVLVVLPIRCLSR